MKGLCVIAAITLSLAPVQVKAEVLTETFGAWGGGGGNTFGIEVPTVFDCLRLTPIDSGIGDNNHVGLTDRPENDDDRHLVIHGINNAEEAFIDFLGEPFDLLSLDVEHMNYGPDSDPVADFSSNTTWLIQSSAGASHTFEQSIGTVNFSGPGWEGITSITVRSTVIPLAAGNSNLHFDNIVFEIEGTKLPEMSIDDVSVVEGDVGTTFATFAVTLSQISDLPTTVDYVVSDGTATAADNDYLPLSGSVTVAAGDLTAPVSVEVVGDLKFEPDETFFVGLSNPINGALADGQGVGTILNDDSLPTITIDDVSVLEPDPPVGVVADFTVTLSNPSSEPISFTYATSEGTATADADYQSVRGRSVEIPAGETTLSIIIGVLGDLEVEDDETFFVDLSRPTNATIADNQGLGTILDNDEPPSITIDDVSVLEPDPPLQVETGFTLTLSHPSSQLISVTFATSEGTATADVDYESVSTITVLIPAGTITVSISVGVLGDLEDETDETFFVNLLQATNATIDDDQGVGTILDNDEPPPSITIDDVSVLEPDPPLGIVAGFTLTLSKPSAENILVTYATSEGTATSDVDYQSASRRVEIPAGETTQSISVGVLGDLEVEADETFFVNLLQVTNATIDDDQGVGTIIDNDLPSLTIHDTSVLEGDAGTVEMVFLVTLSEPSPQRVTVSYFTEDGGNAVAGSDYQAESGSVEFPPNSTSQEISITVFGDVILEPDENFTVVLTRPDNATLADRVGDGVILNDDAPPTLSIDDVSILEGDSGTTDAVFTVTLSAISGQPVTVSYATADGSATLANNDYQATSGSLRFAPGDPSQVIKVPVVGDTDFEPDETFLVNLSAPGGATLADAQGVGTILNDDDEPNLPPDCSNAKPSLAEIWPPNHKMVDIEILDVTDPEQNTIEILVTLITQDEPLDTFGDGSFEPDGAGLGTSIAQVRAERSGTKKVPGNGRVYEISFTADDGNGGICGGSVGVFVPHDKGKNTVVIDDGQFYDSVTGEVAAPAAKVAADGALLDVGAASSLEAANYPNPFNPTTTIQYSLQQAGQVRLSIYNILGQELRTLVDAFQSPGVHHVEWDGTDFTGQRAAPGIYLYRLQAGDQVRLQKLMLID